MNGERNPQVLARLKNERIHASREEIAQSLEGNWRTELLFVLEQSLALYDTYQQKVAECNLRIEAHLKSMEPKTTAEQPPPKGRNARGHRKQLACLDMGSELYRIAGGWWHWRTSALGPDSLAFIRAAMRTRPVVSSSPDCHIEGRLLRLLGMVFGLSAPQRFCGVLLDRQLRAPLRPSLLRNVVLQEASLNTVLWLHF